MEAPPEVAVTNGDGGTPEPADDEAAPAEEPTDDEPPAAEESKPAPKPRKGGPGNKKRDEAGRGEKE